MDNFEIGSCFKNYEELMEKLKEYCNISRTKFTTKDCRLIKDEFGENSDAKERLIYTDLKLICVHGRTIKVRKEEMKRKRSEKNIKTGCPAYFRLKLIHSGVALQIVALNVKHNHPLEAKSEDKGPVLKQKKTPVTKEKIAKNVKSEIKTEDESTSEDDNFQIPGFADPCELEEAKCDDVVTFEFQGLCAPVFTPFNQNMTINCNVIQGYAQYLAENTITGVLINSYIIGESSSMSVTEQKLLIDYWVKTVKLTKQHLMVQIGCCPLKDILDLAKYAEQAGVDSLLCLPNLMCKPTTSDELIDYLKIISEVAPKVPLLYEHSPERTGVNIDMEDFLREPLAKIPTFCGVRYCSVDLETGIRLLLSAGEKFVIFWGTDMLLASALLMGFQSAIVPMSNIFPKEVTDIWNSIKESNIPHARSVQIKLIKTHQVINRHGSVSATKAAMNILSPIKVGLVRYPLKNLSSEELETMQTKVNLF